MRLRNRRRSARFRRKSRTVTRYPRDYKKAIAAKEALRILKMKATANRRRSYDKLFKMMPTPASAPKIQVIHIKEAAKCPQPPCKRKKPKPKLYGLALGAPHVIDKPKYVWGGLYGGMPVMMNR